MPHSHEPTSAKRAGHALLRQQIDEYLGDDFAGSESLEEFLRAVDASYHDFEQKLRAAGAIPLRHGSGEIAGATCRLARQDQTENAARKNEDRFRLAFESSSIGMALLTMEGKWVRAIRDDIQTLLELTEDQFDFPGIEPGKPQSATTEFNPKPPRLPPGGGDSIDTNAPQVVFDRRHLDRLARIAAPYGCALASAAMTLFLDETPRCLEELDQLKTQRQRQSLSLAADSLAKSAASLGAAPFEDALRQLSVVAQKGEWEAVDLISFPQLLESWGQLRDALTRYNPPAQ